jgi:hypothetical protein
MRHGPSLALALAAVFSAFGSVVSLSRLAAQPFRPPVRNTVKPAG